MAVRNIYTESSKVIACFPLSSSIMVKDFLHLHTTGAKSFRIASPESSSCTGFRARAATGFRLPGSLKMSTAAFCLTATFQPMLVLSAGLPFELLECGANQTIRHSSELQHPLSRRDLRARLCSPANQPRMCSSTVPCGNESWRWRESISVSRCQCSCASMTFHQDQH